MSVAIDIPDDNTVLDAMMALDVARGIAAEYRVRGVQWGAPTIQKKSIWNDPSAPLGCDFMNWLVIRQSLAEKLITWIGAPTATKTVRLRRDDTFSHQYLCEFWLDCAATLPTVNEIEITAFKNGGVVVVFNRTHS